MIVLKERKQDYLKEFVETLPYDIGMDFLRSNIRHTKSVALILRGTHKSAASYIPRNLVLRNLPEFFVLSDGNGWNLNISTKDIDYLKRNGSAGTANKLLVYLKNQDSVLIDFHSQRIGYTL